MPRISVTFDPSTETQESIVDLISRIYGGAGDLAVSTVSSNPISTIAAPISNALQGLAGAAVDSTDAGGVNPLTRDKDGLPWDARIHSTPPSMTKGELWRAKKGRDENVYASIRAAFAAKDDGAKTEAIDRPLENVAQQMQAAAAASSIPVQAAATPPAMGTLPALTLPGVETEFQKLESFLRVNTFDPVSNPNGRLNSQYIKENLTNWGVPEGNILALQGQPDATIIGVKQAFAQALGVVA